MIKGLRGATTWSEDLRNSDPARHMVALETDDVDVEFKRLEAAGVEFVEKPTDSDNLVQLFQPIRG